MKAFQGYVNGTLPEDEPPNLFYEERQRSAAVDRATGSAIPYFRKRIVPRAGVRGVLVADIPEDLRSLFESAMRLLGDTGIGGERSHGWGHFKVPSSTEERLRSASFHLQRRRKARWPWEPSFQTRRRSIRTKRTGEKKPLGYEIQRMRVFTGESSDIPKPTVTCLAAGSLFPFLPCGTTENISPDFADHPIFFQWQASVSAHR